MSFGGGGFGGGGFGTNNNNNTQQTGGFGGFGSGNTGGGRHISFSSPVSLFASTEDTFVAPVLATELSEVHWKFSI